MSNSLFDTALEISAASNAADAASSAKAAQNAAEERLEASSPFVNLTLLTLQEVKQPGFFSSPKIKLGPVLARMAVKRTDISHLVEITDDFDATFTQAFLENRSNLFTSKYSHEVDDDSFLVLAGTLEDNQKLLNG